MLAIERKNQILEILLREKRVLVSDLSQAFEVTEETIRRDLEKLEKEGYAKKAYGGAILNESFNVDLPYTVRKKANVSNKEYIANIICSMIEDGDHIMMDASSTAVYAAKHLKNKKNITLITNSIEILLELSEMAGWKVLSTGGMLKEGSLSLVGYQAEKMLENYHVDKAVISCKGLDLERGITDSNEMEAQIKKLMLASAGTRILAADSTKFDRISFTRIGELENLNYLITDMEPSDKWKQVFEATGITLKYE